MSLPNPLDIALLVEAYRYGQFSDDMLDHPSPDCRSPAKPIREALRRVLACWDEEEAAKEEFECCGNPVVGAEYMGQKEMICCGNPIPKA